MKRTITLLTAITLFIAISTNATVWRVNNRVNVDADFTILSSAVSAASANDTIYIEGSPTSYGNITFNKPLTIIGSGYWLNENDSLQAYQETSKVGYVKFTGGSQGSVIEGVTILGSSSYGIQIGTDNITIRRNHIATNYPYGGKAVYMLSSYNSIIIEQNWIEPSTSYVGYANYGIYFSTYSDNTMIRNNIINCDTNDYAIFMVQDNPSSTLTITNNTIWGDIETYNSAQTNNILIYGTYTQGTGDLNSYNLCNGTQYPNTNSNQQNVDMSTVFENYTNYIDHGYILTAGSPATGAGLNGVDCGAYGTNDPYVLGGMPPIPAIFSFEISQSIGSPTIPVTIKAMSHK